jgi:hypothetical protein
MQKHISCLFALFFISGNLHSQNTPPESNWVATRIVERTTLKSKPTPVGHDVIVLEPKSKIKVLDVSPADALLKIRYKEIIYYAKKDAIALTHDVTQFLQERKLEFDTKTRWISVAFCAVRQQPDTSAKFMGELNQGAKVLMHEQDGSWIRISDFSNPDLDNMWVAINNLSNHPIDPLSWEDLKKEEYIRAHPDLEEKYRTAIRASKVILGMDREMTKASLGSPERMVTINDEGDDEKEVWFYRKPQLRIDFSGGKAISTYEWQSKPSGD